MACATGVAAMLLLRADGPTGAEMRIAGLALVVLAVVLVRGWARVVPAPVVALGALYAARLALDEPTLDASAAAIAAGLLLTTELAYWSLDERERIPSEDGEGARRLAHVAALGAATVVVSLALLALADAFRARGLAIDLLGALAAGAAVVGAWALARDRRA